MSWAALLPRWTLRSDAIERCYRFDNDLAALAFAGSVGWLAHGQDHHPDIHLCFDVCTVRWRTHDVDGLSAKDFVCAARCDVQYGRTDD